MEADRRCGKEILGPWVVKQDLVVENAARVGMSARLLTLLEKLRVLASLSYSSSGRCSVQACSVQFIMNSSFQEAEYELHKMFWSLTCAAN